MEWHLIEMEFDAYQEVSKPKMRTQCLVCAPQLSNVSRNVPVSVAWWDDSWHMWVTPGLYPQRLWFDPTHWAELDVPKKDLR